MCRWEYFQVKMPGKHGQGRDNDYIRRRIISGKMTRKDTRAPSAVKFDCEMDQQNIYAKSL